MYRTEKPTKSCNQNMHFSLNEGKKNGNVCYDLEMNRVGGVESSLGSISPVCLFELHASPGASSHDYTFIQSAEKKHGYIFVSDKICLLQIVQCFNLSFCIGLH